MNLPVYMTVGLPGSGKSTWAKKRVEDSNGALKRINKDEIRRMVDAGKWTGKYEAFILVARDALILAALRAGKGVIVDDTNLHPKHVEHIEHLIFDFNFNFMEHQGVSAKLVVMNQFLDVPIETCIKNDLKRADSVGETVIRSMYDRFLKPAPLVTSYNPVLPNCVICDLDGTLALNTSGRNFYEGTAFCEADTVNEPIREILNNIHLPRNIFLLSGRKDTYREQTERWLRANEIEYSALLMRKGDDNRKDCTVKREIYEIEIKGKYNVLFVLDDRNQVVDMWRGEGLTCLQVAPGNF